MRVLLAVLLVGIAGCGGGEHTSSSGVAVPPSPVKADNAEATAAKATSIDDLSDAELAGLLQDPTDEPTTVPPAQAAVEQKTVEGRGPLTFNGHTGSVVSVSFSPDGKRIVSGCVDNTLKVWDISSLDMSK